MLFSKRINRIVFLIIVLALIVTSCAAPGAAPLESETPVMTAELPAATQVAVPTEVVPPTAEPDALRPIDVQNVGVEIGVGSPIPVEVAVAGSWPDLCAQLAEVRQTMSGGRFEIALLASAADPACPPDHLGLPFGIAIPLNMVEMEPGGYTVAVNEVETAFDWLSAGQASLAETEVAGELRPVVIQDARMEVGIGSPIPVEVQVSGTWPDLCAQLAEVRQTINGDQIEISILASAADSACPPDYLGLPFRFSVPLNMVEMPLGGYQVLVNGVETAFEWTASSGEPVTPMVGVSIAYIGSDGNLWVIENGATPRQITTDGTPLVYSSTPPEGIVSYYFPKISSDGRFVAVRREAGTLVDWGMQYEFGLRVYDLVIGESRLIYEKNPAGFDWKPGTHLLAYGLGVEQEYFTTRGGQPNAELATGIWGIDLESGESGELVKPERGLALYTPVWSPDGRYLGFDELVDMEGHGPFAYYDFESGQYVAWEDVIGTYDFAPDSSQIAYDRMSYTVSGEERIFMRALTGGEEVQFSPELAGGYTYLPAFSPLGERLAYLAALGGQDDHSQHLYIQELASGESRDLGMFESVWNLSWTPDGGFLVFHAGPYRAQRVMMVRAGDGAVTILAEGNSPDVSR
jgi:hypothetical protein